jgi:3-phosphoshikimate 1-carboxyvinyltransferase
MVIHGGRPLLGTEVDSHSDHRLAMSLAIAGLIAKGETIINHAEIARVSYPAFWQDMLSLRAEVLSRSSERNEEAAKEQRSNLASS